MDRIRVILAMAWMLAGCATAPMVVVSSGQGKESFDLETWLKEHPVISGQGIGIEELWRVADGGDQLSYCADPGERADARAPEA